MAQATKGNSDSAFLGAEPHDPATDDSDLNLHGLLFEAMNSAPVIQSHPIPQMLLMHDS